MATFDLSNRIRVLNPCSNIDHSYGPYASLDDANTALAGFMRSDEAKEKLKGRTIGIIEENKVVEYWYQKSGDSYIWEKKQATIDYSLIDGECKTENEYISTVDCGAITKGTKIKKETTLEDLIILLTQKTYTPTKTIKPSASLSATISPAASSGYVEVGTTVTATLSSTYTDGKLETYGSGVFTPTNINAGCAESTATYKRIYGGSEVALASASDTQQVEHNATLGYKVEIPYAASTSTAKNSKGENVTLSISEGTASDTKTVCTGKYKFFYKPISAYTDTITASDIRTEFNKTSGGSWIWEQCVPAGTTPNKDYKGAGSIDISSKGTFGAFVAVPNTYKIDYVFSMPSGEAVSGNLTSDEITVADAGGTGVKYTLYTLKNNEQYSNVDGYSLKFVVQSN